MTQQVLPGWNPKQLKFMLWLALPEGERVPKLQRDLASELNVREATLTDWKHRPGFGDEVFKLTREMIKSSALANIVQAQVDKAVKGDTGAARFVFEVAGLLHDESKAQANASVVNIVRVGVPDLNL